MHPWMMAQEKTHRSLQHKNDQGPRVALDEEDQTNEGDHSDTEDAAE